jgi:hypothetical protein
LRLPLARHAILAPAHQQNVVEKENVAETENAAKTENAPKQKMLPKQTWRGLACLVAGAPIIIGFSPADTVMITQFARLDIINSAMLATS